VPSTRATARVVQYVVRNPIVTYEVTAANVAAVICFH
jgi:hypothetical protein